jgi:cell division protein FtsA
VYMSRHIITGIDIGTANVHVAIAEPREAGEISTPLALLGYGTASAGGMRRGAVVDVGDAAESIRQAVQRASEHAGVTVERAYIGFGGMGFGSVLAKGVIAVSRADGEISNADVERVHAVSRANLPTLHNRETLHEMIVQYVVDKEIGIKQPVGMIGNRLEAHILYLTAFSPHLRNLVRAVEQAGITVEDIIPSSLASAYAVLSKHQREIGVLHLDLGGETATCAVFEEGTLISAQVFPVGATHVTNDVAIGFQLPLQVAEAVKVAFGAVAVDETVMRREMIPLVKFSPDIHTAISRWEVTEVIEARTTDIFELVEKYLRKMGRAGLLPSGVVLTGGGAHLPGMTQFSRRFLRLPAEVGTIRLLDPSHELAVDPAWAVAVGLSAWGCKREHANRLPSRIPQKAVEYVMNILRPFIP